MKRKRFTVEQIIRIFREAEVHLSDGKIQRPVQNGAGAWGRLKSWLPEGLFLIEDGRGER